MSDLPTDPGAAPPPPTEEPPPPEVGAGPKETKPDDRDSIGEDERWATSRTGAASSGRRHRRAAQEFIHGDHVAGDKYIYYVGGDRRARLARIAPYIIDQAMSAAHIFPEGWEATRRQFVDLRTAILTAEPGHGRTSAAVRLLKGTGVEVIYHLPSDVDIARIADMLDGPDGIEKGAGFIVCDPTDVGGLKGWVLQTLDDALTRADARLVVITGNDTALTDRELIRSRVPLPPPPHRHEIMKSHFRVFVGDRELAELALTDPGVQQLVASVLDERAWCETAYLLAYLLSQEPHGNVDLVRVRRAMQRRETDTFGIWFDRLPDLDLRSYAIALAVLNSRSHQHVSWAAQQLARRLEPAQHLVAEAGQDGLTLRAHRPDPFRWTTEQRLAVLGAEMHDGNVRFSDPDRGRQVLERAWTQYGVHDELLDWLGALVGRSEEATFFAGAALARLAIHGFDGLAPVLDRWANDREYSKRHAAALALLGVSNEAEHLRDRVETTVAKWYADRSRPLVQATAARVYGYNRHLADAGGALDALHRLLRIRTEDLPPRDAVPLAVALGESLADLVADADADARLVAEVYARLRRWFNDAERSANAQLAFLIMANSLQASTAAGAPGSVDRWPLLLYLAGQEPSLQEPLILLWRGAIRLAAYEDLAESVLTDWAAAAERDERLRDLFTRALRVLAGADDVTHRFVAGLVDGWTDDENLQPLPRTARAVLDALGR